MSTYTFRSGFRRFRVGWKAYLLQSAGAGLTTSLILLFLNLEHAVVIAALGASAFIVFGRPFDLTARPVNVIGGHLIGFAVGSLCATIPHSSMYPTLFCYGLAVGVSVFLMVLLNTQHPPASGTALGIAMRGYSHEAFIAVITITLVLAFVHYVLKPHLRNLF
ncbi:MAG: HPP family protein [Dehalococcoidia bacterium]|nr:HPP family protein [Dehalococcoidia bacterium]